MNKSTTGTKRKTSSFVLTLALAIGFIFPVSAYSQTTMEWLVLSIMRAQTSNFGQYFQAATGEDDLWQTTLEADAERNAAIFKTGGENLKNSTADSK
ncbi:MAG TPA: hypothetical protein VF721_14690 [Pyrinomonadaceae bacterium]|jgi:hypothetical protein